MTGIGVATLRGMTLVMVFTAMVIGCQKPSATQDRGGAAPNASVAASDPNVPTVEDARAALQAYYAREGGAGCSYTVTAFRKVDGQRATENGVALYRLDYQMTRQVGPCCDTQTGVHGPPCRPPYEHDVMGLALRSTGTVPLEKKESGWAIRKQEYVYGGHGDSTFFQGRRWVKEQPPSPQVPQPVDAQPAADMPSP